MKLDFSNKRYSNIIAGILVISVASIFLACAFGVWDHKVISNNDPLPNGVVMSASSGNNIMENNHLVIPSGGGFLPVHEKITKFFDTEDEGWLYFNQDSIPDVFPLTITQADVDSWDIIVYSYGGYQFESGEVDLYQSRSWNKRDYLGTLIYDVDNVQWDATVTDADLDFIAAGEDYTVDIITLNFTIDLATSPSGEINLDSNNLPSLYDSGWMRVFDGPCPDDLDKEVIFKEKMTWSGCHNQDQNFRVILAYNCMLRSPELPIKNFIASLRQ